MTIRYKNIVEAARDAIICVNGLDLITFLNPSAEKLFGYSKSDLLGTDLTVLIPSRFRRAHRAGVRKFMKTGKLSVGERTIELVGLHKGGIEFPLELSLSSYQSKDSAEAIGVIRDITARKNLLRQLEERATIDYLTGLWNRQVFDLKLAEEWQRARRYKKQLSLIMMDLDHFKKYNDIFGHQAGDTVLKLIAKTIRSAVRSTDTAARYGGEEFVVVLPETGLDNAASLAERIIADVRALKIKTTAAVGGFLTISAGVTAYVKSDGIPSDLLKKADTALYQAKREGRDRFSVKTE